MAFVNLLLDALVVALVLHGAITGWLRGFVRVVFMRMRRLSALIIAFLVAKPLGAVVGAEYFEVPIANKLSELLASESASASAEGLTAGLPTLLRGVLHIFGVDVDGIAAGAEAAGGSLTETFALRIAEPAASILGAVVVFVCAYFLVRILLRFVVHLVSAIFALPGLCLVNKTLGFLFGLLFALLASWLFVTLAAFLFELLRGSEIAFFAEFSIDKTYIARYFYHLKPLELLLSI